MKLYKQLLVRVSKSVNGDTFSRDKVTLSREQSSIKMNQLISDAQDLNRDPYSISLVLN